MFPKEGLSVDAAELFERKEQVWMGHSCVVLVSKANRDLQGSRCYLSKPLYVMSSSLPCSKTDICTLSETKVYLIK